MTESKKSKKDKSKLEKECFEAILELWKHRNDIPYGHRPFNDFEPIFNAVYRLDPDNKKPYYYNDRNTDITSNNSSIQATLRTINDIDKAARFFINYHLHYAVTRAVDEKTIEYITKNIDMPEETPETNIIIKFADDIRKEKTNADKINERIKYVEAFKKYSQAMLKDLNKQLKLLNKQ